MISGEIAMSHPSRHGLASRRRFPRLTAHPARRQTVPPQSPLNPVTPDRGTPRQGPVGSSPGDIGCVDVAESNSCRSRPAAAA